MEPGNSTNKGFSNQKLKKMAEIKIVKKKSNSGWAWILILIFLALVAYAVYEFAYKRDSSETIQETPGTGFIITDKEHSWAA